MRDPDLDDARADAKPVTDKDTGDLDDALEDTFPASDPPSMTSPATATPSEGEIPAHDGGSLRVYRVVSMADASDPFGGGGNDKGGRWTSPGTTCVYASRTPAGAMLEFLAHLDGGSRPGQVAIAIGEIPAGAVRVQSNEPSGWHERPYRDDVRQVGDAWIAEGHSLALQVPSALCPDEWNVLLNPAHQDHAGLRVVGLRPVTLDGRLAG